MDPNMNIAKTGINKTNGRRVPSSMAGTEPRSELMTITPEQARWWLAQNSASQRPVSDATVNGFGAHARK